LAHLKCKNFIENYRLENMVTIAKQDWASLESSLQDLTNRVGAMSKASCGTPSAAVPSGAPPVPPPASAPPVASSSSAAAFGGLQRKRLPSVFTSAKSPEDLKLLNRLYTPNIFEWDVKCDVGVEDDVDDLQLRVGARLRARAEALKAKDLSELKSLQANEMRDADEFMQSFDVQQWMQCQAPAPLPPKQQPTAAARSSSSSATCRSNAGPLPARLEEDRRAQWPQLRHPHGAMSAGWDYSIPDELIAAQVEAKGPPGGFSWGARAPPPPSWNPALADIIAAGGYSVPPMAGWPRF